jgi:SAM-dependent methyltransferase
MIIRAASLRPIGSRLLSPHDLPMPRLSLFSSRSPVGSGNQAARHWRTQIDLTPANRIREAVQLAGRDPTRLTLNDMGFLSPMDEFHCLGSQATVQLARLAGIGPGAPVLDIGSGIGGPSRRLVAEFGCQVVGLDITRDYVDAARGLSERLGLSSKVAYYWGDAIDLPFRNRSFDFVWMQVAGANIFRRVRLYHEIARVLRSDGRAAFYEILAGPGGKIHFPVPWALQESGNAVLTPAANEAALAAAGLRICCFQDVSDQGAVWFHDEAKLMRDPNRPPRVGFEVLLPDWGRMAFNQWRNLVERRLFFTYIVAEPA